MSDIVEIEILAEYQRVEAEIGTVRAEQYKLLQPLYERRDGLLKQMAERSYKLPRPSQRTDKQAMVARCPRCRDVIA